MNNKVVRVGEWFVNLEAPDPEIDWLQIAFGAAVVAVISLLILFFAWL